MGILTTQQHQSKHNTTQQTKKQGEMYAQGCHYKMLAIQNLSSVVMSDWYTVHHPCAISLKWFNIVSPLNKVHYLQVDKHSTYEQSKTNTLERLIENTALKDENAMHQKWIHLWSLMHKLENLWSLRPNCVHRWFPISLIAWTWLENDLWTPNFLSFGKHGLCLSASWVHIEKNCQRNWNIWLWDWEKSKKIHEDRWPTKNQSKHSCSSNQDV